MIFSKMKRAVGFCVDTECEHYGNSMFLLNQQGPYICQCGKKGIIEEERSEVEQRSDHWKEVRVEWDYEFATRAYRGVAIVTDNALEGEHSTYVLFSPLIKTERRALKVAESILATLQNGEKIEGDAIPRVTEKIVHFDAPLDIVKKEIEEITRSWDGLRA